MEEVNNFTMNLILKASRQIKAYLYYLDVHLANYQIEIILKIKILQNYQVFALTILFLAGNNTYSC